MQRLMTTIGRGKADITQWTYEGWAPSDDPPSQLCLAWCDRIPGEGDAMGRIVVTEFVSLDGVMEDPGGSENFKYGGWSFEFDRGDEGNKFKLDETLDTDALLL